MGALPGKLVAATFARGDATLRTHGELMIRREVVKGRERYQLYLDGEHVAGPYGTGAEVYEEAKRRGWVWEPDEGPRGD